MAKKSHRPHGTGTIEKHGKRFYLKNMINGKIHRTLLRNEDETPVSNRTDAEKRAKELQPVLAAKTQAEVAFYVAEARKLQTMHRVLIDDIWRIYLKQYDRPDSGAITEEGYHNALTLFLEWLKKEYPHVTYADDVTKEIAEQYFGYVWRERQVSPRTHNGYRHGLQLIFTHIAESAGLVGNPFSRIKRKPLQEMRHSEFTEDQVRAIFAGFKDGFYYEAPFSQLGVGRKRVTGTTIKKYDPPDADEIRVVMMLCCWTGCRGQDASLMRWSNIDMERKFIHFVPRKTAKRTGHKEVFIPIHPDLYQALTEAQEFRNRNQNGEDYVCPNVAHRYIRCDVSVQDEVKKIIRCALKCETTYETLGDHRKKRSNRYSLHSFRHSFVSFCANAGVSLDVVAEIVGHESRDMTRHYAHFSEEAKIRAIQTLPTLTHSAIEDRRQLLKDQLPNLSPEQVERFLALCAG